MKANRWTIPACVCALLLLQACSAGPRGRGGPGGPGEFGGPGGGERFGPPGASQRPAAGLKLKQFDIDANGNIPVEELDTALKATFAKLDLNRNATLEKNEVDILTTARRMQDPDAEPLHDWSGDGLVDLVEFSAEWRTLFQLCDADRNDIVTEVEMKAPLLMPGGRRPGGPGGPGGGPPGGARPGGGPPGGGR